MPALASVPGDGLGCLPGPRPGAATAGPGATPEAVIPVDALAPKKDQELIYLVGKFHEARCRQVPGSPQAYCL